MLPYRQRVITTPAVVLNNPKYIHNVAAAVRACSCFGVSTMIWSGERVNVSRLGRLPREMRIRGYKDVYWENNNRPFDVFTDSVPVCVEIIPNSENLTNFVHPRNAVYIFGPEDGSVSQIYRRFCHKFIFLPSIHCLNLAAAVNIVLYDRRAKDIREGKESSLQCETLTGTKTDSIDIGGWDGN